MDSDEVTSNSGRSQAPPGGHGEFNYVNITLYLQPGVKTGHYFSPQKDIILPV